MESSKLINYLTNMCQSGQATAVAFGSGYLKFRKEKKTSPFNLLKFLGIRKLPVRFFLILEMMVLCWDDYLSMKKIMIMVYTIFFEGNSFLVMSDSYL